MRRSPACQTSDLPSLWTRNAMGPARISQPLLRMAAGRPSGPKHSSRPRQAAVSPLVGKDFSGHAQFDGDVGLWKAFRPHPHNAPVCAAGIRRSVDAQPEGASPAKPDRKLPRQGPPQPVAALKVQAIHRRGADRLSILGFQVADVERHTGNGLLCGEHAQLKNIILYTLPAGPGPRIAGARLLRPATGPTAPASRRTYG